VSISHASQLSGSAEHFLTHSSQELTSPAEKLIFSADSLFSDFLSWYEHNKSFNGMELPERVAFSIEFSFCHVDITAPIQFLSVFEQVMDTTPLVGLHRGSSDDDSTNDFSPVKIPEYSKHPERATNFPLPTILGAVTVMLPPTLPYSHGLTPSLSLLSKDDHIPREDTIPDCVNEFMTLI